MTNHHCLIGLGSNLADPLGQVHQALEELALLPKTTLINTSKFYRSAPMGPADQPDYINAVALISTSLAPLALLDSLQALEQQHNRVRLRRWGERTLDLDILTYGDLVHHCERLTTPHPGISLRNFVLYPIADLLPVTWQLPKGESLATLLANCSDDGIVSLD